MKIAVTEFEYLYSLGKDWRIRVGLNSVTGIFDE